MTLISAQWWLEPKRRPNFLAAKDSASFYVEASTGGQRSGERTEAQRLYNLLEPFKALTHPTYIVGVLVHSVGKHGAAGQPLERWVLNWLDGLDPDDVSACWRRHKPITGRWQQDGWHLDFQPFVVAPPGPRPLLASTTPAGTARFKDGADLMFSLRAKAQRYGTALGAPYLIAVLERPLFDGVHQHRVNALYGGDDGSMRRSDSPGRCGDGSGGPLGPIPTPTFPGCYW